MTPEARPGRYHSGPMAEATATKKGLSQALHDERWYSQTISLEAASCLLGISRDSLDKPGMSLLLHRTAAGYEITADTTRRTALEAFHQWSTSSVPSAAGSFSRDAYRVLYGVFQQAANSAGDIPFAELAELYATTLAELDDSWKPFLDRVAGYGDMAGDDTVIHVKMYELWEQIPRDMRSGDMARYSPDHLFSG